MSGIQTVLFYSPVQESVFLSTGSPGQLRTWLISRLSAGRRRYVLSLTNTIAGRGSWEAVANHLIPSLDQFVLWFDAPDEVLINRLLKRGKQSGRYGHATLPFAVQRSRPRKSLQQREV